MSLLNRTLFAPLAAWYAHCVSATTASEDLGLDHPSAFTSKQRASGGSTMRKAGALGSGFRLRPWGKGRID
jgi:hypothetical protein